MKFDDLHPRLNGFDKLYHKKIYQELLRYNEKFKKNSYSVGTVLLVLIAVSAVILFYVLMGYIAAIVIACLFAVVFLVMHSTGTMHEFFDLEKVNSIFIKDLCDCYGFSYSSVLNFDLYNEFDVKGMIPNIEIINRTHMLTGEIDGVSISVLHIEGKRKNTEINQYAPSHVKCEVLLIRTPLTKNTHGKTIVSLKNSSIYKFFKISHQNCDYVELEDPDFAKNFIVMSSDQVEARYILTPGTMKRIVQFSDIRTVGDFKLAYVDGNLYVTLLEFNGFFNGSCYEITSEFFIKYYIHNVNTIFTIIESLEPVPKTKI